MGPPHKTFLYCRYITHTQEANFRQLSSCGQLRKGFLYHRCSSRQVQYESKATVNMQACSIVHYEKIVSHNPTLIQRSQGLKYISLQTISSFCFKRHQQYECLLKCFFRTFQKKRPNYKLCTIPLFAFKTSRTVAKP